MTRLSIAFQSNKRLSEYGELATLVERADEYAALELLGKYLVPGFRTP